MAQPTLSDTKVKASNHFKTAKRAYPKINESVQLTIARAAIQAEWDAIQANNLKEFSEQLWSDLSELGYDIENAKSVIITKEGDITLKGTRPRKGRWTDDHYSEFIGETFTREVTRSKKGKNGVYTLAFKEPYANHVVPLVITVTDPNGKEFRYPPRGNTVRKTKAYEEATTITGLMQACMGTSFSVRIYFNLDNANE